MQKLESLEAVHTHTHTHTHVFYKKQIYYYTKEKHKAI